MAAERTAARRPSVLRGSRNKVSGLLKDAILMAAEDADEEGLVGYLSRQARWLPPQEPLHRHLASLTDPMASADFHAAPCAINSGEALAAVKGGGCVSGRAAGCSSAAHEGQLVTLAAYPKLR